MAEHLTALREQQLLDLVLELGTEEERARTAAHVASCTGGCKPFVAKHERLAETIDEAPWESGVVPPEMAARKQEIFAQIDRQREEERIIREVERAHATNPEETASELEARKDEVLAEMRRAVAQVKAVRRVEAETAAAKAAKAAKAANDADVIPIDRARWRRTRMLMRTSWAATAAAAAAAVAMWLHGGPVPAPVPMPVAAQTRPDDTGEHAMASAGEQPTDSLSRAQVTAVYHVYDEYVRRALDDYDGMREKIRAAGVPADKVDAVTRQMAKTIELTVRLQRIAPVKL